MKSFGKGFGVGLIVFIVLNFSFALINSLFSVTIGSFFGALTDLRALVFLLFGSIILPPFIVFFSVFGSIFRLIGGPLLGVISVESFSLQVVINSIGFLVCPLIASITSGRLAGGKSAAFGAWFLISIISSGVLITFIFIFGVANMLDSSLITVQYLILGQSGVPFFLIVILLIIIGVINGIFYGCFAMLASSEDFF